MSIHYDKNKKTYTVRWYETNKATGEKVQRAKRGFANKRQARLFEEETENLKYYASFSQLKKMYIDSLIGYTLKETRDGKDSMSDRYMAEFMPMNVRNIKKSDIITWRNKTAELNKSVEVKNKIIRLFKAISRFGAEVYEYPDFAKFLKPFPKTSDDIKEMKIISPDDFNKVVESVDNEVYKRFFIFLYHTGCRRGEAMALQKKSITIDDGRYYAKIENSIRRGNIKTLKNPQSKRIILLDNMSSEAIRPLMSVEGDFIFGGLAPLSPTTITRYFDNALKLAGLEHYRIHDLRHSFVSNAILSGINVVSVSKYIGHSDIERTLNTYSHLLKDSEFKMIDTLNEFTQQKLIK